MKSSSLSKTLAIKLLGNPILRMKCADYDLQNIKTISSQNLFKNMIANLEIQSGIGLAAPQINFASRFFVMKRTPFRSSIELMQGYSTKPSKNDAIVVINPKILNRSEKKTNDFEGCLSVPHYVGVVERDYEIEVSYYDHESTLKTETLSGLNARVFQHECDHLDGILYLDRMQAVNKLLHVDEFARLPPNQMLALCESAK
eukprot:TRINITY_DN2881_c0_g3_i1.p1 TRINITY_DN2881_c0_g3~~TRINITY_DN2881_c0_g3_i1.p1  ORF type:complete len:201 (+),score=5.62 TRINITY_DN2881_c0_g3_i1:106-708(+)